MIVTGGVLAQVTMTKAPAPFKPFDSCLSGLGTLKIRFKALNPKTETRNSNPRGLWRAFGPQPSWKPHADPYNQDLQMRSPSTPKSYDSTPPENLHLPFPNTSLTAFEPETFRQISNLHERSQTASTYVKAMRDPKMSDLLKILAKIRKHSKDCSNSAKN